MTDRVSGAFVAFDKDIRDDDVEHILNAIRLIRHVAAVEVEEYVVDPKDWFNRQQIRQDSFDIAAFTLRYMLTKETSYCFDREKTILALEEMLNKLKQKT